MTPATPSDNDNEDKRPRTPSLHRCVPAHDMDWRIGWLTELLLTGHSWKSVRNIMLMTKPEFDSLLFAAVLKAQTEQAEAERRLS